MIFDAGPPGKHEVGGTRSLSSNSKVLVADADEIVVALISHILHRRGYSVDVALSAAEAGEHLAEYRYDAILVDFKLSSALDRFPDVAPRTILLSTNDHADLTVRAVLRKPLEFGLLVEAVDGCAKELEQ